MTDLWPKIINFEHFDPILTQNEQSLENPDFRGEKGKVSFDFDPLLCPNFMQEVRKILGAVF